MKKGALLSANSSIVIQLKCETAQLLEIPGVRPQGKAALGPGPSWGRQLCSSLLCSGETYRVFQLQKGRCSLQWKRESVCCPARGELAYIDGGPIPDPWLVQSYVKWGLQILTDSLVQKAICPDWSKRSHFDWLMKILMGLFLPSFRATIMVRMNVLADALKSNNAEKERQTPGSYQAVLQSHRLVSDCDDEAWLHWRIWNYRWPQSWENRCKPHRQVEQVWSNQPQIWCATQRSRARAEQPASNPSVWLHCPDNLSGPHGPWRSKMKTHRRQNPGISFSRDIIHMCK